MNKLLTATLIALLTFATHQATAAQLVAAQTTQPIEQEATEVAKKNAIVAKEVKNQLQNKAIAFGISGGLMFYTAVGGIAFLLTRYSQKAQDYTYVAKYPQWYNAESRISALNEKTSALAYLVAGIVAAPILGLVSYLFLKKSDETKKQVQQL